MSLKVNFGMRDKRQVVASSDKIKLLTPIGEALKTEDGTKVSVTSTNASAYFFGCFFYNCCCCFLPSAWIGPVCGNKFCCKIASCYEVELKRGDWLFLMHALCMSVHVVFATMSFTAGAGKPMEVDIFRVRPAWNNTGRNGYRFEVVRDFDVRIDTVTGMFFLLSAVSHSVWVVARILHFVCDLGVWNWLANQLDRCFCFW